MADLGAPPPPRYRVVERDRRLIVIDSATGSPVAPRSASAPTQSTATWWPRQLQFDGTAELTTHPLYDDRAPRTLRLDPGSVALIGWLRPAALLAIGAIVVVALINPWLLFALGALGNAQVRRPLRRAITRWLDRIERAG